MFTARKRLVVTKSAWREMDHIGLSVPRLVAIIEEGKRRLESRKTRKWLAQDKFGRKFVLVRYIELPDKLVVINIGATTRKVI